MPANHASLNICVAGAGAVGGYLAVMLAQAGHDVTVLARGPQLTAIRERGLQVVRADGTLLAEARVHGTDTLAGLVPPDVVVLAVKSHQIAALAPSLGRILGERTSVVALQNGIPWWYFDGFNGPLAGLRLTTLDPDGTIAAHVPTARVIGCVTWSSYAVTAPGVIRADERPGPRFALGEPGGAAAGRLPVLASAWQAAGIDTTICSDIRREKWLKLWGNVAFNPLGALCHATVGETAGFAPSRLLAGRMLAEAQAVAERLGVRLPMTVEQRLVRAAELGAARASTLQDVEAGRALEVDAVLGAVIEIARHLDVPTPNLDAIYACTLLLDRVITTQGVRIVRQPRD